MNFPRRTFLKKSLLICTLGAIPPVSAGAAIRSYRLNRFSIAGFQYYRGPQLIDRLCPGSPLTVIAEPENRHDYYAVRIEWRGQVLGYVPRSDNRHLSRLLRQGAKLRGKVLESESNAVPWRILKVGVELEVG